MPADGASPVVETAPRNPSAWVGLALARYHRPIRDALILVGLGRAAWYFFVQGVQPWAFPGVDARAYWHLDLAHLYDHSVLSQLSAYLYSPAFAQLLAPFGALPFEVFFVLWTAMNVALCAWLVRPWPWAVPMLALPIVYELCVGNIHFLLAALIVVSFRAPIGWALPLLTKITPGIGSAWFVFRGEWRSAAIAIGGTAVIAIASFVAGPDAWFSWFDLLRSSSGGPELLLPRVVLGLVLVFVGARTGRRWLVPVAAWLALPVIWVNSWVMLLATIRLARQPAVPIGRSPAAPAVSGG